MLTAHIVVGKPAATRLSRSLLPQRLPNSPSKRDGGSGDKQKAGRTRYALIFFFNFVFINYRTHWQPTTRHTRKTMGSSFVFGPSLGPDANEHTMWCVRSRSSLLPYSPTTKHDRTHPNGHVLSRLALSPSQNATHMPYGVSVRLVTLALHATTARHHRTRPFGRVLSCSALSLSPDMTNTPYGVNTWDATVHTGESHRQRNQGSGGACKVRPPFFFLLFIYLLTFSTPAYALPCNQHVKHARLRVLRVR